GARHFEIEADRPVIVAVVRTLGPNLPAGRVHPHGRYYAACVGVGVGIADDFGADEYIAAVGAVDADTAISAGIHLDGIHRGNGRLAHLTVPRSIGIGA